MSNAAKLLDWKCHLNWRGLWHFSDSVLNAADVRSVNAKLHFGCVRPIISISKVDFKTVKEGQQFFLVISWFLPGYEEFGYVEKTMLHFPVEGTGQLQGAAHLKSSMVWHVNGWNILQFCQGHFDLKCPSVFNSLSQATKFPTNYNITKLEGHPNRETSTSNAKFFTCQHNLAKLDLKKKRMKLNVWACLMWKNHAKNLMDSVFTPDTPTSFTHKLRRSETNSCER